MTVCPFEAIRIAHSFHAAIYCVGWPPMTPEDFYAHALLAAFPVAMRSTEIFDPSAKAQQVALAHEYAAELTDTFKRYRREFGN